MKKQSTELNTTKRTAEFMNRKDTFMCITASHFLFRSQLKAKAAKPMSLKDAEQLATLLNITFASAGKEFNPLELMRSENEEINESLEYFNLYQEYRDIFEDEKDVIERFAHWYVNDDKDKPEERLECMELKMTRAIIMYIGNTIVDALSGEMSIQEAREIIKEYYKYVENNPLLGITINHARRAFIRAKWRLTEIKTASRKRGKLHN